jgi:hypothetical protein
MPADYAGNSFNQARNINLTTSVTPYRDFVGAADPWTTINSLSVVAAACSLPLVD